MPSTRHVFLGKALALLLLLGVFTVVAPTSRTDAHAADGHPALLQQGSCEKLGQEVARLPGVGATVNLLGTPVPAGQQLGPPPSLGIDTSVGTINMSLTDVATKGHALILFESDEAMDHPIACGNVGGTLQGDTLVIGLPGVNQSGDTGVAVFTAMGAQTKVAIYLAEPPEGSATPAS